MHWSMSFIQRVAGQRSHTILRKIASFIDETRVTGEMCKLIEQLQETYGYKLTYIKIEFKFVPVLVTTKHTDICPGDPCLIWVFYYRAPWCCNTNKELH